MLPRLMAGWIVTFTFKYWRMNCSILCSIMVSILLILSFSRIMTLSTLVKRPRLAEHENPPNGIHELWERVEVEWEKIAVRECQKLVESMPKRVRAVLKAKGGYTKY